MSKSTAECVRNYLQHCRYEKNLSPKSIKAYSIDLNQFTGSLAAKCEGVEGIDKTPLREYIRTLSEGNKPKTVKRKVASLKAFFNYLEFEDIIAVSPFRKLRVNIKEGKRLPKTIPLSKITDMFAHVSSMKKKGRSARSRNTAVRDMAVMELLFSTGVRVGELCNLKRNDVDLSKGSVRVIGKGNKERLIPLCSRETIEALQEYRSVAELQEDNANYFFLNRRQRRLSEQSVRFMIKKYTKKLRIEEHITPHMFRHFHSDPAPRKRRGYQVYPALPGPQLDHDDANLRPGQRGSPAENTARQAPEEVHVTMNEG